MKTHMLPEEHKYYELVMSTKNRYVINGVQKQKIFGSQSQFVELTDGSTINKSFIAECNFLMTRTRDNFRNLPEPEQNKIVKQVESTKKGILLEQDFE